MSMQDIAGAIGGLLGLVIAAGLFWVWPITAGIRTARRKKRSAHWMWFGIHPLGGWIAYGVLLAVKPLKECTNCAEKSKAHARQCPYCGQLFADMPPSGAPPVSTIPGAPAPPAIEQRRPRSISGNPQRFERLHSVGVQVARPLVVSVLAVLLLIGGVGTLVSLPFTYDQIVERNVEGEALALLHDDDTFHTWAVFGFWVGALLAIPQIVVGIGLWRLQVWALRPADWLLWWSLLSAAAGTAVLNYVLWFKDASPAVMAASQAAKGERFLIFVTGTLTGFVMVGLYSFFIARLRREPVRAQFA